MHLNLIVISFWTSRLLLPQEPSFKAVFVSIESQAHAMSHGGGGLGSVLGLLCLLPAQLCRLQTHTYMYLYITTPLRGQEMALGHGAIEAHVEGRNRLPLFGRFDWVLGTFWAKKGCFGAQNAQFWEGTSRLGAPIAGRHR